VTTLQRQTDVLGAREILHLVEREIDTMDA
jgi:hypothetical protein